MAQIFFKEELKRLLASIDSLICIFSMESSKLLRSFEMKILFCGGEAAAKKIVMESGTDFEDQIKPSSFFKNKF